MSKNHQIAFFHLDIKKVSVFLVIVLMIIYIPMSASSPPKLQDNNRLIEYSVLFTENGLATGLEWNVRVIENHSISYNYGSNNSTVEFRLTNGSYTYVLNSTLSYFSPESSGCINISGSPVSIHVNFFRVAISEAYLPFIPINVSQVRVFNLFPQLGASALSFGVMNTTVNIQVTESNSLIYNENVSGQYTNFQASMPTNGYGYINFNATSSITITATDIGKNNGYFAYDLWNYYISNYSASMITMPPHYAEYFGTGSLSNEVPCYVVQNYTGVSFAIKAPFYRQPVPLSIWISGGFFNRSGQIWWAQNGFNNWATGMYDVSYAGWGALSEQSGNSGGRDTNYPLIPNETYNFTMEQLQNGSWGFFVNGQPVIEQGVSAYFRPPVDEFNQAYLGVELLNDQRAGPFGNNSIFNGSIIITNAESFRIGDKWVRASNISFRYGGQDWEDGHGGPPPGYSLFSVEGNLQNGSIPPGEIVIDNGNHYPYVIPSDSNYDVYPISGNFSLPFENYSSSGKFITISKNSNGTILVSPLKNNTLISIVTFKNQSSSVSSEYNLIISKPVYITDPALYSDGAIFAVPINNSTSNPTYSGIFQEIGISSSFPLNKNPFSLGNVSSSYQDNLNIPVYYNSIFPIDNLEEIFSYDPSLMNFSGIIDGIASQSVIFNVTSPAAGLLEVRGYGSFDIFRSHTALYYLSFRAKKMMQFSTEVLLDSSSVDGNTVRGNGTSHITVSSGWQSIGASDITSNNFYGDAGGVVSNIGYSPYNMSVLYAAAGQEYPFSGPMGYPGDTGFGGVFRSINGGKSWTAEDLGLNTTSVTSIIVNPNNDEEVVIETRGTESIIGGAIYKTINGGESWQETYGLGGLYLQYLNGTLYAATFHSLLYSKNFGTTWSVIENFSSVITSASILENGKVIYLGLYIQNNSSLVNGMPAVNDEILLSSDWGANFSTIWHFNQTEFDNKPPSISQIVTDPSNNENMWAIVSSPYNGRELGNPSLFRSSDAGHSWQLANTSALGMGYLSEPPEFITYDPSNSSIIYVDSIGSIFKSTDGGQYFERLNTSNMPFSFNGAISVDPLNDSILFICTGQGLYESVDQGRSWFYISNMSSNLLFDVASDGSNIFATDEGLSPLYSSDYGREWTTMTKGFLGIVSVDPYNSSIVLIWTETHTTAGGPFFFVSDNGGNSFFLPEINFTEEVNMFVDGVGFSNKSIYVPGGSGIFFSNDSGLEWNLINDSPSDAFTVAVNPDNPRIVYATNLSGIFESDDYGFRWVKIGNDSFESVAVDPLNSSIIVGTSGSNAMISYNGGLSFTELNIASSQYAMTPSHIYFQEYKGKAYLIFTSYQGLYISSNLGNNWTDVSYNIPSPSITSFFVSINGTSFVSTYGAGIWRDTNLFNFSFFRNRPLLTGYIPEGVNLTINGNPVNNSGYFSRYLNEGTNVFYSNGQRISVNTSPGSVYFYNFSIIYKTVFLKTINLPANASLDVIIGNSLHVIKGNSYIEIPSNITSISILPVGADFSIYYPVNSTISIGSDLFYSSMIQFRQVSETSSSNLTGHMVGNFWATEIAYNSGYVLYGGGGDVELLSVLDGSVTDLGNPLPNGQVFSVASYKDGFLIGGTISSTRPGIFFFSLRTMSFQNISYYLPNSWNGSFIRIEAFPVNNYTFGFIGGAYRKAFLGMVRNDTFINLTSELPSQFIPSPDSNYFYTASFVKDTDSLLLSDGHSIGVLNLENHSFVDMSQDLPDGTYIGPSSYSYWSPSGAYMASSNNVTVITGEYNNYGFVGLYSPGLGIENISGMFPQGEIFDTVTTDGNDFVLSGVMANGSSPILCIYNPVSDSLTSIPTGTLGDVSLIDSAIIENSSLFFTSFDSRQYKNYSVDYSYYFRMNIHPTGEVIVRTNALSKIQIGNISFNGTQLQEPVFSGTFNISIQSTGYESYSGEVVVKPFSTIFLNVTLQRLYNVTFTESGLLPGTSWSVTLNGTTKYSSTNTITFNEPNGTYSYTVTPVAGYTESPPSGTINVNGANVTQPVTFTEIEYTVTFTESGLPSGTVWYINISNGQSYKSTGTEISLNEPNGTYSYVVSSSNKSYSPNPSSGSFTVNGSTVSRSISFSQVIYIITFKESGLPSGTSWSVTLNGVTETSTNSTITFHEPYGTYSYSISLPSGYKTSSSSGSIKTSQPSLIIPITVSSTSHSSSTSYLIYIIIAMVVIAAVIGAVLAMRRGKK